MQGGQYGMGAQHSPARLILVGGHVTRLALRRLMTPKLLYQPQPLLWSHCRCMVHETKAPPFPREDMQAGLASPLLITNTYPPDARWLRFSSPRPVPLRTESLVQR